MYKIVPDTILGKSEYIQRVSDNAFIPMTTDNMDYQRILDDFNENGASVFDGDVPDQVIEQAAEKQFNKQLSDYKQAVARLSQYVLSEGRPEVKEIIPTGETKINLTTGKKEEVLIEVVTQTAIDPLPTKVDIWEQVEGSTGSVKKTVRNPAIVQDEAERAAAQAIVDATPEEVKAAA